MGPLNRFFKRRKSYFKLGLSGQDQLAVQQEWGKIQELVKLGSPSRFKNAIIEADKLLDNVLEKMGYSGNLGEKLKTARDRFVEGQDYSVYNDVWQAHKCRNQIVHEVNKEVLSHEVKDIIKKFEKGFKKLGTL